MELDNNNQCDENDQSNCLSPSYDDNFKLEIKQFENSDFSSKVTESIEMIAGDEIFLSIRPQNIYEGYKFAVTECSIVDLSNREFLIINPGSTTDPTCDFSGIGFTGFYDEQLNFNMRHILFVLQNDERQSNFSLECTSIICEKNIPDSLCNKAALTCLESDVEKYNYMCNELCNDDEKCFIGDDGFPICEKICEAENKLTRIVGGFPFHENSSDLTFYSVKDWILYLSMGCGATWISSDTILTAAHCFDFETDENGMRLNQVIRNKVYNIGDYDNNNRTINDKKFLASFLGSQVTIHPEYDTETKLHDLALVKLCGFEKEHSIVNLPKIKKNFNFEYFWIYGWGALDISVKNIKSF